MIKWSQQPSSHTLIKGFPSSFPIQSHQGPFDYNIRLEFSIDRFETKSVEEKELTKMARVPASKIFDKNTGLILIFLSFIAHVDILLITLVVEMLKMLNKTKSEPIE